MLFERHRRLAPAVGLGDDLAADDFRAQGQLVDRAPIERAERIEGR